MQCTVPICLCSTASPTAIKYLYEYSVRYLKNKQQYWGRVKGFFVLFIIQEHIWIRMLSITFYLWTKIWKVHTSSCKWLPVFQVTWATFSFSWRWLSVLSHQGCCYNQLRKLLMCTIYIILISVYLLLTYSDNSKHVLISIEMLLASSQINLLLDPEDFFAVL